MAKKVVKKAVKKSPKKATKKEKKSAPKKAAKKVAKKALKKVVKKITVNKKKTVAKKAVKKVTPASKAKKVVKPVVKKALAPKKAAAKASKVETPKFVAHSTRIQAGDIAPHFEGKDQNGNLVSKTDLAGKTIILYFYPKDDTPGCTATACSLRDEYQHLSNSNYAVVGVSADDEKSHSKFASKYSLPFPLIADTDHRVMKAYDVWGQKMFMGRIFDGVIRTTFVINNNGIIDQVIKSVDTANHAKQILGTE